jgi:hypothetical protein
MAARARCAIGKLGRRRRIWPVETVNDAGINLCPLGNAAIASRRQRKEKSRMLYRSHNIFDQALVMMIVILLRSQAEKGLRHPQDIAQNSTNCPSIDAAKSLYSADL